MPACVHHHVVAARVRRVMNQARYRDAFRHRKFWLQEQVFSPSFDFLLYWLLGISVQKKQGKSCVESLFREVEKEEKIGVGLS